MKNESDLVNHAYGTKSRKRFFLRVFFFFSFVHCISIECNNNSNKMENKNRNDTNATLCEQVFPAGNFEYSANNYKAFYKCEKRVCM